MDTEIVKLIEDFCGKLKGVFSNNAEARKYFETAQKYGIHLTPNHFYYPIPDTTSLTPEAWTKPSALPGIDMNEAGQVEMMGKVFSKYTEQFKTFRRGPSTDKLEFTFDNDQISGADPFIIYSLIREFKPKKVIEVGSGYSTLVTRRALLENGCGALTCVEPYPRDFLKDAVTGLGELVKQPVQSLPPEFFSILEDGDFLIIDSTHVVKIGSDVNYLILEVLPRIKSGVWIHFHDIFLPYDYPEDWIRNMNFFWSEQYLLQAFLSCNDLFEVKFSVSYMGRKHIDMMLDVFPGYGLGLGGGSIWLRRR